MEWVGKQKREEEIKGGDWSEEVGASELGPHEKPARACVEANMAREQILVEICIIAAVKNT